MRKSARSALAGLFASGLLVAMAAAATGAEAAAGPGSLDPGFGTGGKVLTNLNLPAATSTLNLVTGVAVQPNGDIVVSGSFGLVRYLPGGKLDTSFGTNGVARTGFAVAALAIQPDGPDGEYVVAGQEETGPELRQDDFAVARLTASGTLDPAFGHGGVVLSSFPDAADGAGADAVLVEPDGDILAGGQADVNGPARNEPVVAQGALALYHPGGALVSSFGSGGLVQTAAISGLDQLGIDQSGVVDEASSQTLIEHFNGTAWSLVPSPSPGSANDLSGVTTSNAANDVWAVGSDTPAGASAAQTLTLNWNGTAWSVVASPDPATSDTLNAVATSPGAAIVWAAGATGTSGSFNPLVLQNG